MGDLTLISLDVRITDLPIIITIAIINYYY